MNRSSHALPSLAAILLTTCPAVGEDPDALPHVPGSATVVMVPDFDEYYPRHTNLMDAQTKWIADNAAKRNIAYVVQLGDLTNHNTASEWEVARRAFAILDGEVPYAVVPGNHDYDDSSYEGGTGRRSTRINEFFKHEEFKRSAHFGGAYEEGRMENTYHLLTIHDRDWLILCLEFGPRDEVVAWANRVLDEHKDRLAIVNTHAYLFYNSVRYDRTRGAQRASPAGWGNEGQELWSKLIRRHPNVMIVMCGHLASAYNGYRVDEAAYGNHVHQMLCDYEKLRGGGMGYMRLLEFLPDGKTVQVRTYSPALKQTRGSELEEFQFTLKLADRTTPTAEVIPLDPRWKEPIHRYSFNESAAAGSRIADAQDNAHGVLSSESRRALCRDGKLLLPSNEERDGYVKLPPGMLDGLTDVSVEVWFTPTAETYDWNSVWRFMDKRGTRGDFFWYAFRTLTVHRAESAVDGHNLDIQLKGLPIKPGQSMHVVVTYDDDGNTDEGEPGKPLLRYFRDGKLEGQLNTTIDLSKVTNTDNRVGPFAGSYDELRIYDIPLGPTAVKRSFDAGPERFPD